MKAVDRIPTHRTLFQWGFSTILNAKMPANFIHDIMRGHSRRFIDEQRAIQRRKFLHHISSITFHMLANYDSVFEEKTDSCCQITP